jgi:CRP-like cAMP-binding protein
MTPDVIDVLRRAPLFAEMDEAELAEVAAAMNECNAHPGEVVTAEDGPGDGFFVIDAGDAEVLVGGQVTGTMGAGDFFGEIALLTGGSRTATIRAVTDLRCYALTPWDFRTLVEDHPTIAWKALQAMAVRLA